VPTLEGFISHLKSLSTISVLGSLNSLMNFSSSFFTSCSSVATDTEALSVAEDGLEVNRRFTCVSCGVGLASLLFGLEPKFFNLRANLTAKMRCNFSESAGSDSHSLSTNSTSNSHNSTSVSATIAAVVVPCC
jgi:hypothetical protein